MKAIQLKKFSTLKFVGALLLLSGIFATLPLNAFAQEKTAAVTQEDLAKQLKAIKEQLDKSAEREKKILENQDKIIAEVIKSRTWIINRRG